MSWMSELIEEIVVEEKLEVVTLAELYEKVKERIIMRRPEKRAQEVAAYGLQDNWHKPLVRNGLLSLRQQGKAVLIDRATYRFFITPKDFHIEDEVEKVLEKRRLGLPE